MKYIGLVFMIAAFVILGILAWDLNEQVKTTPVVIANAPASYEEAIEQARAENKPVLLIFTASWCGPCQQMKKSVYPSAPVQAVANRLIWLTVDVDLPANQSLTQKHGISGIPALVIIDANGRSKSKISGGRSPADLARWLADNS
jgi:thiol:disulfide interchange protein